MITIVNYGSGNIRAICNILDQIKSPYKIADSVEELSDAKKLFLPGVGAFDETMSVLNHSGFRDVLDQKALVEKVPVLGICVGMQILGERSEEGRLPGLGWIRGDVKKFTKNELLHKPKLPHMGWNSIAIAKVNPILNNLEDGDEFYFLHSFYFSCEPESIITTTDYGHTFASIVNFENIYGIQFHPEKSHLKGLQIFKNFTEL